MNISPFMNTNYVNFSPAPQSSPTAAPVAVPSPSRAEDTRFDRFVRDPFTSPAKTIDGKTVSDINEDRSCKTCESRTYQDGSDDPSVSFKSPTSVPVGGEAAAVMGHEREHVANETANAKENNRKVVSQAIRIYTAVCNECKRVYVSGGTTTTVTKNDEKSKENDKNFDIAV